MAHHATTNTTTTFDPDLSSGVWEGFSHRRGCEFDKTRWMETSIVFTDIRKGGVGGIRRGETPGWGREEPTSAIFRLCGRGVSVWRGQLIHFALRGFVEPGLVSSRSSSDSGNNSSSKKSIVSSDGSGSGGGCDDDDVPNCVDSDEGEKSGGSGGLLQITLVKRHVGAFSNVVHYEGKVLQNGFCIQGDFPDGPFRLTQVESVSHVISRELSGVWEGESTCRRPGQSITGWKGVQLTFAPLPPGDGRGWGIVVTGVGDSIWNDQRIPFCITGRLSLPGLEVELEKQHVEGYHNRIAYFGRMLAGMDADHFIGPEVEDASIRLVGVYEHGDFALHRIQSKSEFVDASGRVVSGPSSGVAGRGDRRGEPSVLEACVELFRRYADTSSVWAKAGIYCASIVPPVARSHSGAEAVCPQPTPVLTPLQYLQQDPPYLQQYPKLQYQQFDYQQQQQKQKQPYRHQHQHQHQPHYPHQYQQRQLPRSVTVPVSLRTNGAATAAAAAGPTDRKVTLLRRKNPSDSSVSVSNPAPRAPAAAAVASSEERGLVGGERGRAAVGATAGTGTQSHERGTRVGASNRNNVSTVNPSVEFETTSRHKREKREGQAPVSNAPDMAVAASAHADAAGRSWKEGLRAGEPVVRSSRRVTTREAAHGVVGNGVFMPSSEGDGGRCGWEKFDALLVASGVKSSRSSSSRLWSPLDDCKEDFDAGFEAMAATAAAIVASSTEAAAKASSTTSTAGQNVVECVVGSGSESMSAKTRTTVDSALLSLMSSPDAQQESDVPSFSVAEAKHSMVADEGNVLGFGHGNFSDINRSGIGRDEWSLWGKDSEAARLLKEGGQTLGAGVEGAVLFPAPMADGNAFGAVPPWPGVDKSRSDAVLVGKNDEEIGRSLSLDDGVTHYEKGGQPGEGDSDIVEENNRSSRSSSSSSCSSSSCSSSSNESIDARSSDDNDENVSYKSGDCSTISSNSTRGNDSPSPNNSPNKNSTTRNKNDDDDTSGRSSLQQCERSLGGPPRKDGVIEGLRNSGTAVRSLKKGGVHGDGGGGDGGVVVVESRLDELGSLRKYLVEPRSSSSSSASDYHHFKVSRSKSLDASSQHGDMDATNGDCLKVGALEGGHVVSAAAAAAAAQQQQQVEEDNEMQTEASAGDGSRTCRFEDDPSITSTASALLRMKLPMSTTVEGVEGGAANEGCASKGKSMHHSTTSVPVCDGVGQEGAGGGQEEGAVCRICFLGPADVLLLPCGHCCTCTTCAWVLLTCPVCEVGIHRVQPAPRSARDHDT